MPIPARRSFVAEVHARKQQHLKDMVERGEIPLRAGKRARPAQRASCAFLYNSASGWLKALPQIPPKVSRPLENLPAPHVDTRPWTGFL